MPESITVIELRRQLASAHLILENSFGILRGLCDLFSQRPSGDAEVQELVLRAMEYRDTFGSGKEVLDALVRELGLFPYLLEPEQLSLSDRIAYEFHRPPGLEERNIVFHRPQATVYRELMAGRNVVLSAPTSFGKSMIIDAVIASERYRNILLVVPTIALIDETRRRLAGFVRDYKIITHSFQSVAKRNVYVMTQERVLELPGLPDVDFFVIDEFYKLSPHDGGDGRAELLNQVFYQLARRGAQFYLLGPNVHGIVNQVQERFKALVISEPAYHTVVSELHVVPGDGDELERLAALCRQLSGPTIIFCKSPSRTTEVVNALLDSGIGLMETPTELAEAADWLERRYHEGWHVPRALRRGIGVHHGRIPRAIGQWVVRAFNDEAIQFLVCTSTLIEGVNTKAQNMIILDNKIDRTKFDLFTFNNIRGRSGRMFRHFIGHVYLFHEPPADELPLVDVPSLSQSDSATDSLLLQLAESDLTDRSVDRLKRYHDQTDLRVETLRANIGLDPERQIAAAREILQNLSEAAPLLVWRDTPNYKQLSYLCGLMWRHFRGANLGGQSVRSANQLAVQLLQLQDRKSARDMISSRLEYSQTLAIPNQTPDQAVQNVIDFLRLWASFHAPRLLRALSRIQADVLSRAELPVGSYDAFAGRLENLFLDSAIVALDEYGVPLEIARRLTRFIPKGTTLDDALQWLATMDVSQIERASAFEQKVLLEAQRGLGVLVRS